MRIDQQLSLPASADRVWSLLLDVPTMAQCIPGAEAVQTVDPEQFTMRVRVRIGPVTVAFDCHVAVLGLDPVARKGTFEITGRDTRIGAGLRAVSAFVLEDNQQGTTLVLHTDTDISGKIAQYGHGIIRQRADATLQDFGRCVGARLSEDGRGL